MKKQYTIDAVGTLYPMIMTDTFQSLFRIECTMQEEVDGAVLQQAVDAAFLRYPYFKVCLKEGKYRYFFEDNDQPFVVRPNDGDVLAVIDWAKNNGHLVEVSYLCDKIVAEFFHALTDANGGVELLKTIVYYYIAAKYGEALPADGVLIGEYDGDTREYEDSQFTHRNKGGNKSKVSISKMIGKTAFCPRGEYHNRAGFDVTSPVVDSASLKTAAKKYGCSVTQYLAAVATFSVAELYNKDAQNKNIVIFIPVNLRSRFSSKTMRNFVTFAKCAYKVPQDKDAFAVVATKMRNEITANLSEEELQKRLNFSTLLERLPLTKYMPLRLIKWIVGRSNRGGKQSQTFILSNIGVVNMPKTPRIRDFALLLNTNVKTPRNIAVATYGNRTRITFTSRLVEKDIEEFFINKLKEDGVTILES